MPDLDEVRSESKGRRQKLHDFRAGCESGGQLDLDFSRATRGGMASTEVRRSCLVRTVLLGPRTTSVPYHRSEVGLYEHV